MALFGNRIIEKNVHFQSFPQNKFSEDNVWMIVGDAYFNILKWYIDLAISQTNRGVQLIYIGENDENIPPSMTCSSPMNELEEFLSESVLKRIIVVDNPNLTQNQIWNELQRCSVWDELVESPEKFNATVIVGTSTILPRAGKLARNLNQLLVYLNGNDLNDSLKRWIEAICRDVFENIRVQQKIQELMFQKGTNFIIHFTSESEELNDRVQWQKGPKSKQFQQELKEKTNQKQYMNFNSSIIDNQDNQDNQDKHDKYDKIKNKLKMIQDLIGDVLELL